jgi:hypothetical protein
MRTPHTAFKKGTTIRVVMRDGTVHIDKFIDKKSGVVVLKTHGRIPIEDIRVISIYKNQTSVK